MQILKKLSLVLWCASLSFTPAGAQEWEVFTETLIDFDQNGRVKTKTGFVNGSAVKDSTQYTEKPKIRHSNMFKDKKQIADPEITALATELMLEGYRDFTVKTSFFGRKSLVMLKDNAQTKLGLSKDFFLTTVDTRVDEDGEGIFTRQERVALDAQDKVDRVMRQIKRRHDQGREERNAKRLPSQTGP